MRVISGSAKGKRLHTLDGMTVRPTIDRVKEALFSMIQFELAGRRFLDLFAGSGQIGIEALSRGASFAVFVEKSHQAARMIQQNLTHTGLSERALVQITSVSGFLSQSIRPSEEQFDLVFLDPPYQKKMLDETFLTAVAAVISPGGTLIYEHLATEPLPALPHPFSHTKSYCYGKVMLTRYHVSPSV